MERKSLYEVSFLIKVRVYAANDETGLDEAEEKCTDMMKNIFDKASVIVPMKCVSVDEIE